jgi:hypothetical protein
MIKNKKVPFTFHSLLPCPNMPLLHAEIPNVSLAYQLCHDPTSMHLSPKDTLYPFLQTHFEEKLNASVEEYTLPSWKRQALDRENAKKQTVRSGDTIVRDMNHLLDNIGIVRHDYQIYFHQKMIETHLRKIYENEWATFETEILQKFNLSKIHQERLIVCPRRFGKTYSAGSFGCAATWCIPSHEIGVFSTGKRAAGKMMALTITFLLTIPGFREKCDTHNVENLVLKFSEYDSRKLSCYPGTVGVRFAFHLSPSLPPPFFLISLPLSHQGTYPSFFYHSLVCVSTHGARVPSPLYHVTRVIDYPPTSCE